MVKLNRKKITATTDKEVVSKHKNIEGESTEVLQKLIVEEANLIEEKENLTSLRKKLQLKVQKEIENKKNNIQQLRDEIVDLKISCEAFTKSLKELTQKRDISIEADVV